MTFLFHDQLTFASLHITFLSRDGSASKQQLHFSGFENFFNFGLSCERKNIMLSHDSRTSNQVLWDSTSTIFFKAMLLTNIYNSLYFEVTFKSFFDTF